MAYVSLYRKYRSQTFGDLIGQDHVVRTLRNAIASGRIAQTYLFTGPRGTGKTSTARLLAKALCAADGPTADFSEDDPIVRDITAGTCIDVVEMDAASDAGVDDVRERIIEVAEYRPMVCRYKVFIIDEVHDLSPKAFDALLKTVEEPPPHLIFVLATTEYSKVPPTIRSRCQKFEFHRASMKDLVDRLTHVAKGEGIDVEPAAVSAIARMADGGYRDALTLLEQAILVSDGRVTLDAVYDQLGMVPEERIDAILDAMRRGDVATLLTALEDIARMGRDPRSIVESMIHRLADLTRAVYGVDSAAADAARDAVSHETATRLGRDFILRIRGGLAEAHKAIRDITLPRLWLESELVRLSRVVPEAAAVATVPAAVAAAPSPIAAPATGTGEGGDRPAKTRRQLAAEAEAAKVTPPSESDSAPAPEPPNEPEPVLAAGTWETLLAELNELSKALGMKLREAMPRVEEDVLVLVLGRLSTKEWFDSKPKAVATIAEATPRHYGRALTVRFELGEGGPAPSAADAPEAVELPLEGEALVEAANRYLKS